MGERGGRDVNKKRDKRVRTAAVESDDDDHPQQQQTAQLSAPLSVYLFVCSIDSAGVRETGQQRIGAMVLSCEL